jgi:hypothetical protein
MSGVRWGIKPTGWTISSPRTPPQARINLETTIAVERAVATGKAVRLPPETWLPAS